MITVTMTLYFKQEDKDSIDDFKNLLYRSFQYAEGYFDYHSAIYYLKSENDMVHQVCVIGVLNTIPAPVFNKDYRKFIKELKETIPYIDYLSSVIVKKIKT